MEELSNLKKILSLRLSVIKELLSTLWSYKLWWAFPIIIVIFLITAFLLLVGYSGVGVFLYPLI